MCNTYSVRILMALLLVMMVAAIPLQAFYQPGSFDQVASDEQLVTVQQVPGDRLQNNKNEPDEKDQDHWHELIVKWKVGEQLPTIPGTKVIAMDRIERLAKLSVDDKVAVQDVIAESQSLAELEYIQPNYRYKLHAIPNDPEYVQQWHHKKINMPRAWDIHKGNTNVVIAVLDTGVDVDHPDLKPNLVPGYNVISPNQLPIDDYGHGTQVAGVLGAVGNNQQFGTGILWNARIMPIKVLDGSGEGDDYTIGQGIRYAVRNGANIIVLSLGDRLYSKHMEDAVAFAEEEGVLLIAATGNNGSTVNYPAAFPTVLAVGASDIDDRVPSYSNFGPEVDVVAPGQGIYTTTMNGQMTYNSGTSMSAPIVAGIAALILNKYPEMEPWEVRQLLRQSSTEIGTQTGWDQRKGYGRVDAYRALTLKPTVDLWSPNKTWEQAKIFPQSTTIHSALQGVNDIDWFYVDVRHRGKVQVPFQTEIQGIGMNWYSYQKQDDQPKGELVPMIYSSDRLLEPGRYYVRIRVNNWNSLVQSLQSKGIRQSQYEVTPLKYEMEHRFLIAEDSYESNNSINQAASIDVYQAERFEQGRPFVLLEGTFHRNGDLDWYSVDLPHSGELSIEVVNSYGRMDPVLTISKTLSTNSSRHEVIDDHAHGAGEFWQGSVEAGNFYFMVADYQQRSHPVPYQVKITYTAAYNDRWEPNNTKQDAPTIQMDSDVYAFLDGNQDQDWFAFIVEEQSHIMAEFTVLLPDIMLEDVELTMRIFESTKEVPTWTKKISGQRQMVLTETFSPGVYYVQLYRRGQDTPLSRQVPYKLKVKNIAPSLALPNITIYEPKKNQVYTTIAMKISGQTSVGATVFVNGKSIVVDQEGRFSSQQLFNNTGSQVLRIQSTNMAGKSVEENVLVTYQPPVVYTDLSTPALRQTVYYLTEKNIVQGYPDKTFRPERSLTRAEMVALILRAMKVDVGKEASTLPSDLAIRDVNSSHWAFDTLRVAIEHDLIIGFSDQTIRPDEPVTRAQLATILKRAFRVQYEAEYKRMQAAQTLTMVPFKDVPNNHWAYQDIQRNAILGYMDGFAGEHFLPDKYATRKQVVTALYRILTAEINRKT